MKPWKNEACVRDAFYAYITDGITSGEVIKKMILYYDTSDKINLKSVLK